MGGTASLGCASRSPKTIERNVARTRTTKKLAQRIDLNYFKRSTPFKRAKFWLSLLLPFLALLWIAEQNIFKDSRVYSSGRLSEPHAVLEKECAACHAQKSGSFSAKASDSDCLDCHDGPIHHASQTANPACATCHTEHRGRINIAAASNRACATCHAQLKLVAGAPPMGSAHIRSFQDGHPEFTALRSANGQPPRDPNTIRFNHAVHGKPIRRSPSGPNVQLDCSECHRPRVVQDRWAYSDPDYANDARNYERLAVDDLEQPVSLPPKNPLTGREWMAPPTFGNACAGCHILTFDKRFEERVPHARPQFVHGFLVEKFTGYIAAHPEELHEVRDTDRDLTGKPLPSRARTLTPSQWIAENVAVAQELLWRKTCKQCHALNFNPQEEPTIGRWSPRSPDTLSLSNGQGSISVITTLGGFGIPKVARAGILQQWFPHSKFDHEAHRGFTCVGCHAKALTSTESSDVLIPGIATCKTCHGPGPGHAESRCFECHTYHDWSKRKQVSPKFTLPALRSGGH